MKLTFLGILLLLGQWLWAYQIEGQVQGLASGKAFLGHYYASAAQTILLDTANINTKGYLKFNKNKALASGMYFIQLPDKKRFEFYFNQENTLIFSTNIGQIILKMTWQNSDENANYYDLLRAIEGQDANLQRENKKLFYQSYPNAKITAWLKAQDFVEVPVDVAYKNGKMDTSTVFSYQKKHYFDNLNLKESDLLHSSFLEEKLLFYLQKMTYPVSDSILVATDRIMALAGSEIQKYFAIKLTSLYENPPFVGGDKVCVEAIDRYYTAMPALWNASTLGKMAEKAKKMRPLLLGQIIPDLTITDPTGKEHRLLDQQSPITILYLYSLDCPHCKEHAPKLAQFQQKMASKGVKVFAVAVESDAPRWKKFISTYHTENLLNGIDSQHKYDLSNRYNIVEFPMNYILDSQKRIIGKRINPAMFEAFLDYYKQLNKK